MTGSWRGGCLGGAIPSIEGLPGGRRSSDGVAQPASASIASIARLGMAGLALGMAFLAPDAGGQAIPRLPADRPPHLPPPVAGVPSPPDHPLPAGAALPLTLTEAVALGLRDNRTIRSAYLDRIAQRFTLVVARSAFVPRITLAGAVAADRAGDGTTGRTLALSPDVAWLAPTGARIGFVWDRRRRLGMRGTAADDTAGRDTVSDVASLFVSQPLLRGGGLAVNRAPIRIAELQERINRLALRATVIDTVSAIVFAYRQLVQAQEQVRLADLSLERTRELLDTNRALIAAGRLPAADIVQTEAGLAAQEVLVIQARQARTSAQLALLRLLAADPRTNAVASEPVTATRVPIDVEAVVRHGLAARPDALAQMLALEQSRQALLVARNDRLWELSIDGNASRAGGVDPLVGRLPSRSDGSVALRLAIPLYEPALRQQEIQATTNLRTAELRYQDLYQGVETQVRDAVQTVDGNWLQLETARRARALAAQALDIAQAKLAVGRTSNFEVLSFQTALRTAESQELTASIGYQNALTALDQQIGSTLDTWRIVLSD